MQPFGVFLAACAQPTEHKHIPVGIQHPQSIAALAPELPVCGK